MSLEAQSSLLAGIFTVCQKIYVARGQGFRSAAFLGSVRVFAQPASVD